MNVADLGNTIRMFDLSKNEWPNSTDYNQKVANDIK